MTLIFLTINLVHKFIVHRVLSTNNICSLSISQQIVCVLQHFRALKHIIYYNFIPSNYKVNFTLCYSPKLHIVLTTQILNLKT